MFLSFDTLENILLKVPYINSYYYKKASKWKKNYFLFLHKLGLLKPSFFVQWLATYDCNLFCPYCEASAGKAFENELNTKEVKNLIDDMNKMKCKRFLISGGEPLLRPDLIEIMQYANRRKLSIGLVTNGYLVEDHWKDLKNIKYFQYFTSIDGISKYHDKIRGKEKSFEKALKGLDLFYELGVSSRIVNTVVHPGNIDQLEDLLEILKESSANQWILTPTSNIGRAVQTDKYSLSWNQIEYLLSFIRKNKRVININLSESHTYLWYFDNGFYGKPFFCRAGLTRCSIMPEGEVLACQQVYDLNLSEGNIREKSFIQIWKEEFKQFRRKMINNSCNDCLYLDSCQCGCWAEMKRQQTCSIPIIENKV